MSKEGVRVINSYLSYKSKMKILHLNTQDFNGGAAKAAYRLHKKLLQNNLESKMLVVEKIKKESEIISTSKNKVDELFLSKIRIIFDKLWLFLYKKRQKIIFSPNFIGVDITKLKCFKEADIIHLHWINNGFLNYKCLSKILDSNKRVIWTFHDSWPFTGGCHLKGNCLKYQTFCEKCEILNSKVNLDLSKIIFNRKVLLKEKFKNIIIISPSQKMAEDIKKSKLFGENLIKVIPNVVDEKIFKKIDKTVAREILGLDKSKKYILFGACLATTTPHKGYSYLLEALKILENKNKNLNLEVIVFGSENSLQKKELSLKINYLGEIKDEITLSLIYNSANVFVAPSLEDNLPNTVNESLTCGTPVVSFDIGGMRDMIIHQENGYLAKYKDSEDLCNGILETLNKGHVNNKLNHEKTIQEIIELYRGV